MTDVARAKYLRMMAEIEDIEDKIAEMEKIKASQSDIMSMKDELAEKRNELAKISDGCGKGHSM
jgi:ribosome-interacting GTPase 1